MAKQKYYSMMTEEEQLSYVEKFGDWYQNRMALMQVNGVLNKDNVMECCTLLMAWQWATDFAEETQRNSNLLRRIPVLERMAEQAKQELSKGMTVTDGQGNEFAYVPGMKQARRRGRPTREEAMEAEKQKTAEDTQARKKQKIAEMLGMPIVTDPQQREKNNEELRAEREEKEAQEKAQQPSLFDEQEEVEEQNVIETPTLSQDQRMTLQQLKPLLSQELQRQVDLVRDIRNQAAGMAERAKALAEAKASSQQISDCATKAASLTEEYERIYARCDKELAEVYVRLKEDKRYKAEFMERQGMKKDEQMQNLMKMLKPYFKTQPETFKAEIMDKIAAENPEVIAEKEAQQARKKEADAIIKYLMRKDKPSTKKRYEGMLKKYQRLQELMGEEFAKPYLAVVDKVKRDVENG